MLFISPLLCTFTRRHFHSLKRAVPPPPFVTHSLFWMLADENWRGTGHTNAFEWVKERTAQGHVIPCWAGCQRKRGLFHMALVSWWPASEMWATLSSPCIILGRRGVRAGSLWGGVLSTPGVPNALPPMKSVHTHGLQDVSGYSERKMFLHIQKTLSATLKTHSSSHFPGKEIIFWGPWN